MTRATRLLTDAEVALSDRHAQEAFGITSDIVPPKRPHDHYGIFDGEALMAQTLDIHFETLIGGRALATAGIGGVTVAPEYRGRGAARAVMSDTLASARERGAVLSTLFGAAPALYRSLGYELVSRGKGWSIPVTAAAGIRVPDGLTLRESRPEDAEALRSIYSVAAGASALAMVRDESNWPDFSRVTVVHDESAVLGYMAWKTDSSNNIVTVHVEEVAATTAAAYAALMRSLGTWASVASGATIFAVDTHPALGQLSGNATPLWLASYMLRVLDVQGALSQRGWAPLSGTVTIAVDDPMFAENSGIWQLTVDGGVMTVQRLHEASAADAAVSLSMRGLAEWFTGQASMASIAKAEQASIADAGAAALLDAWAVLPTAWISERF